MSQAIAPLLDAAFAHHQNGRAAEAEAGYRQVLALEPAHRRALLLLGMLLAAGPATIEAEALLRRFLESATALDERSRLERGTALFELAKLRQTAGDDAEAVPLFEAALALLPKPASYRGLALSLHRLARPKAALAASEAGLALDVHFAPAHLNHGLILAALNRLTEAAAAFQRAVSLTPGWSEAWANLGNVLHLLKAYGPAETAMRQAIALDQGNVQARFQLAQILEAQQRFDEARACNVEAGRRHGVMVHPCSTGKPLARVLLIGGADSCNVMPLSLFDQRRYELLTTYLLPGETGSAPLPPFDIAFNAVADLDRGADVLAPLTEFCRRLDRPLLNPPDQRMLRTRRDRVEPLFAGIAGLVMPQTRRLPRAALLDQSVERPMLLRPAGTHGGDDFHRIETKAQLDAALAASRAETFYLSRFLDYRSRDGFYRKYRFIFIDRVAYPYHLVVGEDWLLHYFRADMATQPRFKQEEEAFLEDWRRVFPAAEAVDAIGRRLDLDYAGLDCGLDAGGRLVLFEANPCMLVHLHDSAEDFPYKHRAVPRIFQAMERMVAGRS
jgi:Flp pilus assembly protein TadD